MAQLIQRLLKLRREGRLKAAIISKVIAVISTPLAVSCMHWGMFALSCWLARRSPTCRSREVGVYRYQGVSSWVDVQGSGQEIYPARMLTLNPVRRVGYQCTRADLHSNKHHVTFPSVSINTLRQVDVIGGTEMVFTPEETVLYDELALGDPTRYGSKVSGIMLHGHTSLYLPAANRKFMQCMYYRVAHKIEIPRAISLLKDHSQNYYHWLLECLPRAILALRRPDLADYPLLIDEGLPGQLIESLRLLSPTRQHISIPNGLRVPVQELCFPSVFSPTHDYYGRSPRAEDFLIAPEAVTLLRESFLIHKSSRASEINQQFIYVARSGGAHRSITNEAEIILALEKMGFTTVYPGKLQFGQQIALFANAKIIVGPTGAGMANIVFSKAECKIAVLAPVTNNANYYLFAQIAQHLDREIVYVGGKPSVPSDLHSDYQVDVSALRIIITEFSDS